MVKAGERSDCLAGKRDCFDSLAAARPQTISLLDPLRADLEDPGTAWVSPNGRRAPSCSN
jgi:hypothetical protein